MKQNDVREDDVIMTPKEKAKDLTHKFYFSLPNNGSQTGINNVHDRWNESKNCALIVVDEMLRYIELDIDYKFLEEVKQEIEKL